MVAVNMRGKMTLLEGKRRLASGRSETLAATPPETGRLHASSIASPTRAGTCTLGTFPMLAFSNL